MEISKRYKSHHDALKQYERHIKKEKSNIDELGMFLENTTPTTNHQAIYFHIPFCDNICSFCNLNRTYSSETHEKYVGHLVQKIVWYGSKKYVQHSTIKSIYFGGGTPTVLNPNNFKTIFQSLKENVVLADDCEISVETTLHNLTDEHINIFNKIGVNRISIGIQTFSNRGRKVLNRKFDKNTVLQKLKHIKTIFNGIVCIDIIYNYPKQTKEDLLQDIKIIQDLDIASISFYSLMLQEGSVLSKKISDKDLKEAKDKDFHDIFVETLLATGKYELLELTKIVKKGIDRYQYIQVRHKNGDVIPVGKGAGGSIGPFDMYNINEHVTVCSKHVSTNNALLQKIYGALQNTNGGLHSTLSFLTPSQRQTIKGILTDLDRKGFVRFDQDNYQLTSKGLFYGNNVSAHVVEQFMKNLKGDI